MQTLEHKPSLAQSELWLEDSFTKSVLAHLETKFGHSLELMNSFSNPNFTFYTIFNEKTKTPIYAKLYARRGDQPNDLYISECCLHSFDHPNITPLFYFEDQIGFPSQSGSPAAALTVVEAPLFDTLNEVYLVNETSVLVDEKLARTFFKQIVSALECMHAQGVYHTNLSLESIMLTDNFLLKLGDFHYSLSPSQKNLLHHGIKDFRAPEICNGKAKDFSKADMYSLGIILFVLRYDCLPYTEPNPNDEMTSLYWECPEEFWGEENFGEIDAGFRELFEMMVVLDHNLRATWEDVKKSVWYNGETYSNEEVIAIMRKVI